MCYVLTAVFLTSPMAAVLCFAVADQDHLGYYTASLVFLGLTLVAMFAGTGPFECANPATYQ